MAHVNASVLVLCWGVIFAAVWAFSGWAAALVMVLPLPAMLVLGVIIRVVCSTAFRQANVSAVWMDVISMAVLFCLLISYVGWGMKHVHEGMKGASYWLRLFCGVLYGVGLALSFHLGALVMRKMNS
jgi:hypothetical protein